MCVSLMWNYGFTSLVNHYTRITNLTSSCIDLCFVRYKIIQLFKGIIFHLNITDHSLLSIVMICNKYTTLSRPENSNKLIDYNGVEKWSSWFRIEECF